MSCCKPEYTVRGKSSDCQLTSDEATTDYKTEQRRPLSRFNVKGDIWLSVPQHLDSRKIVHFGTKVCENVTPFSKNEPCFRLNIESYIQYRREIAYLLSAQFS